MIFFVVVSIYREGSHYQQPLEFNFYRWFGVSSYSKKNSLYLKKDDVYNLPTLDIVVLETIFLCENILSFFLKKNVVPA